MKKGQVTMSKEEVRIQRERRYFSESARRAIVKEIDQGLSKAEASRKYEVSQSAVYKWMVKYSAHYQAALVKVVEHASDSNKVKKLEAELQQAYALLGRAKAESIFLQTVIEKADEEMGTDLKKNIAALPSQPSTSTKPKSK
jgi:transposase